MQIEKKAVTELRAAEYNPRKDLKPSDAEYEKLKLGITGLPFFICVSVSEALSLCVKFTGGKLYAEKNRYACLYFYWELIS